MEWLKKLLEGAKIVDGKLDVEALMKDINTEFPKNAVPKETFNDINGQLKKAKEIITERDGQIEKLKGVDTTKLTETIEQLKKDNKTAAEKYEEDLKELKLTTAIKLALSGKAQDETIVASLIDKTKLVVMDDKILGLDEQVETLKKDKAFLFKSDQIKPGYDPKGGKPPVGSNPFAKDTFNLTEQGKLMKENPAQAKEMAAAAGITLDL